MTLALALDSALGSCSVAIGNETAIFADAIEYGDSGQAERLVPLIDRVLKSARYAPKDLTRIGITTGPGSFTGIRIGLATARALGLALSIPVFGITTLRALALEAPIGHDALIALDARHGFVYSQLFSSEGVALTAPLVVEPARLIAHIPPSRAPLALLGSAIALVQPHLAGRAVTCVDAHVPKASVFVNEIARYAMVPDGPPRPLYLRPSYANQVEGLA